MAFHTSGPLPSLPPLPPLQMPESPGPSIVSIPSSRQVDSEISLQSPVPSMASRESFSTAFSSSSQVDFDRPPGPSSLAPPQSLRKSISVDSFVKYGRDGPSPNGTRPNRGNTGSALDPPRNLVFGISAGLRREREQRESERSRGTNVNTVGDAYDQSLGDSDAERSDSLHRPGEGHRRVSLKGQDQSRPFIRGGELPLPSRTPTLSSTSSMSSMSATTNSSTQENMPRLDSTSSMQSMPRRGTSASLGSIVPGRVRSGSLGMYASSGGKRILINTQVSAYDVYNQNSAVTLAVVGAPGCGKSVAIRKGLKSYALSEPSALVASTGAHASPRYTRRIGRINHNENTPDCLLHVMEVDVPVVILDPSTTKAGIWPEGAPRVDGVIICYDASDEVSFRPVESLLRGYHAMKLPTVVLACKSDLKRQVEPEKALEVLQQYDAGLVEVTSAQESGKEKMRRSFDWLLKAVFRDRRTARNEFDANYRNPASPDVLISPPPWENSRTTTPTASSSMSSMNTVAQPQVVLPRPLQSPLPTIPSPQSPNVPSSPTRARSTGDFRYERERSKNRDWQLEGESPGTPHIMNLRDNSTESVHGSGPATSDALNGLDEVPEDQKEGRETQSRPAQWATLEELLDKLLFLAVSGDDPAYITHFLLTYRRFASPRSVLLAMQKRMRQLDNPSGDPMFACFAQMRICHLLEQWIRDYPYDFAVRGTAGALSALIKSIIAKTYLLHYGSDFLPFLELLPSLVDKDAAWAMKVDDDESDDSYSLFDDEDDSTQVSEIGSPTPSTHSPTSTRGKPHSSPVVQSRERKPSLPLTAKTLVVPNSTPTLSSGQSDCADVSTKHLLKDLVKVAQEVNALDSDEIAQEITRLEAKLFLEIEPRHWLQYTLVSGKKDPQTDYIARFNEVSNHLADWVVSLILCHDRAKARAKQIEKFVEIAQRLRTLNNYSALRAFVAGINNSTFPGDQTMELFKTKSPEQAKNLQSWDVLLQHIRSHRAYRLALRNTKGACIPALEVHMSDLIRAHEGNPDFNAEDPTKVHWGKFNMMGRFITSTTLCQAQCQSVNEYNFPERPHIQELIFRDYLMNDEMQKSRIAPPDTDVDDGYRSNLPRTMSRENPNNQTRDVALLRKFFFW